MKGGVVNTPWNQRQTSPQTQRQTPKIQRQTPLDPDADTLLDPEIDTPHPVEMATEAVGKRPTGINSCFVDRS